MRPKLEPEPERDEVRLQAERLRKAARACLLGGAIGDALGAPIEFLPLAQIRETYGPKGVTDFVHGDWPAGSITDDTQMTLFTAEALIRAKVRWIHKGLSHGPSVASHAYLRWLQTQGEQAGFPLPTADLGLLFSVPELHARRAPGNTCLSALKSMTRFGEPLVARNTSKGCGGVMRMAPVGLFDAKGNEGAWQIGAGRWSFDMACDFAALTHGHPTGFLTAGVFAVIIGALATGAPIAQAVEIAVHCLIRREHSDETLRAIRRAQAAAADGDPSAEVVERLGGGWIAEEALSIGIYCALVSKTFEAGVLLAVNHSGDSDSTGSIAGNLLGLIHGEQAIPKRWLSDVELGGLISRVAEDLIDCPDFRSIPAEPKQSYEKLCWAAYPGW